MIWAELIPKKAFVHATLDFAGGVEAVHVGGCRTLQFDSSSAAINRIDRRGSVYIALRVVFYARHIFQNLEYRAKFSHAQPQKAGHEKGLKIRTVLVGAGL